MINQSRNAAKLLLKPIKPVKQLAPSDVVDVIRRARNSCKADFTKKLKMTTPLIPQNDFNEITQLIHAARQRAVLAVNTALIELYWQVGQFISRKIAQAEWGDGVVAQLAEHLARTQPGLRGFTRSNLFRMRKFYESYQGDEIVAPLVRQLSWSHNLTA